MKNQPKQSDYFSAYILDDTAKLFEKHIRQTRQDAESNLRAEIFMRIVNTIGETEKTRVREIYSEVCTEVLRFFVVRRIKDAIVRYDECMMQEIPFIIKTVKNVLFFVEYIFENALEFEDDEKGYLQKQLIKYVDTNTQAPFDRRGDKKITRIENKIGDIWRYADVKFLMRG